MKSNKDHSLRQALFLHLLELILISRCK